MQCTKPSPKTCRVLGVGLLAFVTAVSYLLYLRSDLNYSSLVNPKVPIAERKNFFKQKGSNNLNSKGIKAIYNEVNQLIDLNKNLLDDGLNSSRESLEVEKNVKNLLSLQETLHNDIASLAQAESRTNKKELDELQNIVNKRLIELQNPISCSAARKLLCVLTIRRGLGCLLHHYATCLFIALGTNRTMILDLSSSNYADMEEVFQPVSRTCDKIGVVNAVEWEGEQSSNPTPDSVDVVKVSIAGAASDLQTLFAAFTIPRGIASRIERYHSAPDVWWIGQIMKYLTRLKPSSAEVLQKVEDLIGLTHPVVGIHIRRTDKIQEADYYGVNDYMSHVVKWYDRYDLKIKGNVTRKVYVATDEPDVILQLVRGYPDYVFLHDPLLLKQHSYWFRYVKGGLMGIVVDLKLLSQCDFFVGTYSSNVGRLVYELMQADGERTFDSLSIDLTYYFFGGVDQFYEALESHKPQVGEIEMKPGDLIRFTWVTRISYKGYGENQRTKKSGSFPMHKVMKLYVTAPYPGIF